jgi:serine/threonine-protein kinase RsbW
LSLSVVLPLNSWQETNEGRPAFARPETRRARKVSTEQSAGLPHFWGDSREKRLMLMTNYEWTWSSEERISSDPAASRRIVEQVLRQLEQHEWVEHDIFSVHLALEEALVNAIKHGNRLDPRKKVHFVCKINANRLLIEITDEGNGFNPSAVPDCTADENLENPSGRGITLMRSFMTSVEYNSLGNGVVMEKRRENGHQQAGGGQA